MRQRFTERSRKAIFYAQEEAGRFGENHVETEHMLLGLVREDDSVAAHIIGRLGVSLESIRSEVERQAVRGDGRLGQDMQLTPRSKRVIDLAYDEARQLDNNYIGTEHLLLGLIREEEGLAGRTLASLGLDLERTRHEVRNLQNGIDGKDVNNPSVESHSTPMKSAKVPDTLEGQLAFLRSWLKQMTNDSIRIDIAIGKLAEAEMAVATGKPPLALSQLGTMNYKVIALARMLGAALVVEELDKETGA